MRIGVQVIDALGIESRTTADDAMYFIPLRQEQFCQVRTILAGNTSDECSLHSNQQYNDNLQ
jgi:hypothetical protein